MLLFVIFVVIVLTEKPLQDDSVRENLVQEPGPLGKTLIGPPGPHTVKILHGKEAALCIYCLFLHTCISACAFFSV